LQVAPRYVPSATKLQSRVMLFSREASELPGKVVSVTDGNTLRVLVDDQQIKIRLGGIDASESDQPFAVFVTFC
jgi:endonuclease YncB( thermonuclease family)